MDIKRGDVVLVAEGKPRPAVVVQSDRLPTPVEILICPLTTTLMDAPIYRLRVEPNATNGLKAPSQLMVDKVGAARFDRIDRVIGHLSPVDLARLDAALLVMLDLMSADYVQGTLQLVALKASIDFHPSTTRKISPGIYQDRTSAYQTAGALVPAA